MNSRQWMSMAAVATVMIVSYGVIPVSANNLRLTNTVVQQTLVEFDIAWENSWRTNALGDDLYFHDAAWVFFKVRVTEPETGSWQHLILANDGLNPTGFSTGTAGGDVELLVPPDRVGMFVRRSDDNQGFGTLQSSNVHVRWNLAENGISPGQTIQIGAFGVEMVYVAEGPFWAGDGLSDSSQFVKTLITNNDPTIAAVWDEDLLLGEGAYAGGRPYGQTAPDSSDWPNGFTAFYSMKYQITQGQYADFLNTLTEAQSVHRSTATTASRYTIGGAWPNFAATAPDRACNYLSWTDGAAFADWAGLRPMTELEYEKACRGPVEPIEGEYAWGSTWVEPIGSLVGVDGSGTETYSAGNASYDGSGPSGPVRVGVFATNGATRVSAGASYWGIMELSGNLWERPISIGVVSGRAFTGVHGDGIISSDGAAANQENWPTGGGFRGTSFKYGLNLMTISCRSFADRTSAITSNSCSGFRAVRTAPAE